MKTRIVVVAVFLGAALALTCPASRAGDKKDPPTKAKEALEQVNKHLDKIGGLKSNPTVTVVDDAALEDIFPGQTFVAVRFRQYPVAFNPPEGLKSSNVFAVTKEGKMEAIGSVEELTKYFKSQQKANMTKFTEKNAGRWTQAWLALWQELLQDGFYGFDMGKALVEAKGDKLKAETKSTVTKGGKGEIAVTMEAADDGAVKITPVSKIMPGPRPICQATKLLDPDPIVRHMAETELLFMGISARTYLLEQRAKAATPELRFAIDRILGRIEAIGW